MRPVRLELQGFGTFRDRTVVSFEDLDLVAFVGPTGSGKSTVIDAITFALYGSVARYDNPSRVAPVIHQLATEAKVRLDFELGGSSYTAVRVVRRVKGGSSAPRASTREARLERVEPGGATTAVLAGNVSELDDEVERLLGLDFGQFTRTIVLPQGDFAEFLTDDPSDRQKLLRRLLDIDIYARMGAVARQRAAAARQQLEVYESELERLADATPERLASIESRAALLARFVKIATELVGRLAGIEADLEERRDSVNRLDAALGRLNEVALPPGLSETDAAAATAKRRLVAAETALAEARRRRDETSAELDSLGDPVALAALVDRRRRAVELTAELAGAEAERAELGIALAAADTGAAEKQLAVDQAVERARAARLEADAAVFTARLQPGEPCPVCHQTVTEVVAHADHDEVAAAEQEAEGERQGLAEAQGALVRAQSRVESVEARLVRDRSTLDDVTVELAEAPGLDELLARAERLATVTAITKDQAGELRATEAEVEASSTALQEAEGAEGAFRATFSAQRDAVAEYRPPRPGGASLADDWVALAAWTEAERRRLGEERSTVAEAGKALASDKAELLGELAAAAEPLAIDPDPATIIAATATATARAEADLDHLRERLVHKTELVERTTALREQQRLDEALGRQHLSANGFERWLLAEALDDIVARATERLFELSNGRYSLEAVDGSFNVCDHGNADERRDVRTLSGGEIFLASLSLALALASSIAELAPVDSPRLESIFLDEGFGTLDGETLDVLASAIEELSADGRLVAIVTHVRDLAERMPVRFEVRKGPTTSVIERSDG